MRGRKPQSAEEKRRAGNPSRRPINDHEPQYERIDTATPKELTDPTARAEWDRLAPMLSSRGHATTADRSTLIAYCLKYAQWVRLETAAAAGEFLVPGAHGGMVANPLINMANKAYALFLRAAVELGVTPSQRPRVSAIGNGPAEAVDEFTEFQRARPPRIARVK
jgi:P27 family predicted phage terminase small subunit